MSHRELDRSSLIGPETIVVVSDVRTEAAAVSVALSSAGFDAAPGTIDDVTAESTAILIRPDGIDTDELGRLPSEATVIVAGPSDEAAMLQSIELGALAFVEANAPFDRFVAAVAAARQGEATVPPHMLGGLLKMVIEQQRERRVMVEQLEVLSPRERQVFELVAQGADKNSLAAELFISPDTARTHIQNVMRKLGTTSRVELVGMAAAAGIPTVRIEGDSG